MVPYIFNAKVSFFRGSSTQKEQKNDEKKSVCKSYNLILFFSLATVTLLLVCCYYVIIITGCEIRRSFQKENKKRMKVRRGSGCVRYVFTFYISLSAKAPFVSHDHQHVNMGYQQQH